MKLINNLSDWRLERHGETLLRSSGAFPMIFVGCGQESVDMYLNYFYSLGIINKNLLCIGDCPNPELQKPC